MATGLAKNVSVIGVEKEVTEGTYVAPSAATSYIQPLADGFELSPSRETIDRGILTNSIGKATPRLGQRSVDASLPVEFRASGVEGADVDFAALLESALGAKRSIAARVTTKASGNTGSVLQIEDADISALNVGDVVCVLEAGGHHVCAISAKDSSTGTANVTITPAKQSGSFSNSVEISKATVYYTANSGHPALSLSYYWANQIRQTATGCKVTSLSLDNFSTGQVASLNFSLQGLGYGEVDGAAPHTPSYDSGIPPILLGACVHRNGVKIDINELGLSLENTLAFLTSICNENGKSASRITERTVTGSINPYKDDTSTSFFSDFDSGTEFSLFVKAYIPSSTSGEHVLGSIVGIYLPKCIATGIAVGDQDGILTDAIDFQAVRGSDGATEEMYMGFI